MIQKCIIACYSSLVKDYVLTDLKLLGSKVEIIVINNKAELVSQLEVNKDVIVYFDKIFLGFYIKQKIKDLKVINNNARFVFVEIGQCPIFFGMRLHNLNINGFICGIEDFNAVKNPFLMTFNDIAYFPEEVLNALNDVYYRNKKNFYSEVTERENEIIIYKIEGKHAKEISALINNISLGTISTHFTRFCKKTGCNNLKEIIFLAESTKLIESSV